MAPKAQQSELTAEAREWNRLVATSTVSDSMEVIRAVVVDSTITTRLRMFCFSSGGAPLCEGVFLVEEDSMLQAFSPFVSSADRASIIDVCFTTEDCGEELDGIILGCRSTQAFVPMASLSMLRERHAS